jgi:phenylpropionate dioxygenase-like ring-hydroxylating dioxygenase large terminal subunit
LGEWFNDEFPTWNFAELVPLTQQVFDTGCNWKLAMDTFGETYHFSVLHRDTLFNGFHGNVQCYDEAGHLHRMILCKRDIDAMRLLPEEQWDITVAGLPVYWIFPNVILLPFDAGCFLVRAYPDRNDPGRHVSHVSFYLKPALAAIGDEITVFAADIAEKFSHVIRDEDYAMASSQQTAANSGALRHVIFGRNEPALHHYHNTYLALLGLEQLPLLDEAAVTNGK